MNKGVDVSVYSHDIDPSVFDGASKEKLIEFNKIMSQITKRSEVNTDRASCFLCKENKRFIVSHSIPESVLYNIAINGYVDIPAAILGVPKLGQLQGVQKAGTFRLLCSDCDNNVFSDYENSIESKIKPSGRILAEIALKTYLKELNKKFLEIPEFDDPELRKVIYPEDPNNIISIFESWVAFRSKYSLLDRMKKRAELDKKCYLADILYAKKYIDSNYQANGYYLHYYKQLDYVVPIAFQGRITLWGGFDDEMVNCINDKEKYSDLHICIFPMRYGTKVFMFTKNNDKTLRRFIKSFNRLDPEDQLRTICYIIFVYSEEIYMNPELKNKLGEISGVKDAITSIGQTIHTEPVTNVEQTLALIRRNSLTKRHNFPNLLSEKYKINI